MQRGQDEEGEEFFVLSNPIIITENLHLDTEKGIAAFPIIIELYLFSINFIDENLLNESQMSIKKQIISNRLLFEDTRKSEYIFFVNELKEELNKFKLLAQLN